MGFKADGQQYFTKIEHTFMKNRIWPDIVHNSDKIVHLLDMCGHEKYLKTTMHGMTSLFPDYAMIMVGGNMGVSRMTKEHIGIAISLDIPLFVVITKTDIAPESILKENLKSIATILKNNCGKIPVLIKDSTDIEQVANRLVSGKLAPVFTISNQSGQNVDMLRNFIGCLKKA